MGNVYEIQTNVITVDSSVRNYALLTGGLGWKDGCGWCCFCFFVGFFLFVCSFLEKLFTLYFHYKIYPHCGIKRKKHCIMKNNRATNWPFNVKILTFITTSV